MTFAERLGRRIGAARKRAKLTKSEAAALAGFDYRQWHLYETGQKEPSASRLFAIAKALDLTADDLSP